MPTHRSFSSIVYAASDVVSGANQPSGPEQGAAALRNASRIVEETAYEAAGSQPSSVVSQLIMISADLERLAQLLVRTPQKD